jgi:hypothetical protein
MPLHSTENQLKRRRGPGGRDSAKLPGLICIDWAAFQLVHVRPSSHVQLKQKEAAISDTLLFVIGFI